MRTIKRLLVANRGEIACRVIRTCRRLGIESVAVFSDADRFALHSKTADLACHIGGASASESYLNAQAIIDAALRVKADAIHPGYGFLSESTELIRLCIDHGIVFVGPSLESIADMGSKIEAKAIAEHLGIPTVPGYNGDDQSADTLENKATAIGFPVLIKASAGGGGKGMRIVNDAAQFASQLKLAKQEAINSFGDDRVLLEKYITRPRHIEVQLLGDSQGNVLHLLDRECSIQRNYQKVIEEAPVSHMDAAVRQSLFDCAVRLGKHLSYRGAGTVEFIYDADSREAYFLEMNTRLQVEHPTTEMVTGLDLVEWQIRIAQGEAIGFTQASVIANGHAIEARVNAEDPANDYMPEIGAIKLYREPQGEGLRVDSGVTQGSEITPYYDSMIAKVIAWGQSRGLAAQRLLHGLNNFAIGGVKTNQEFLTSLITRPAFHQELSTQYIANQFPQGWKPWGEPMHMAIAAAAYCVHQQQRGDIATAATPWQSLGGWRLTTSSECPGQSRLWLQHGGDLLEFVIASQQHSFDLRILGLSEDQQSAHCVTLYGPETDSANNVWQVEVDGTRRSLDIAIHHKQVALSSPRLNRSYVFLSLEESQLGAAAALKSASNVIRAHMPGLITDVLVGEGDKVEEGQIAVVMEAMKLIHNMPCPCAGTVVSVQFAAGDKVEDGALILEIESEES